MDPAIALVQAYLRVNGYFTITEYPLFEILEGGTNVRAITDLDILAFRFPRVGRAPLGSPAGGGTLHGVFRPDPDLAGDPDKADMILAEVKGGPARFNEAILDPRVLGAGLARFGCCAPENAEPLARILLRRGSAKTEAGHIIRTIAFGSGTDDAAKEQAYRVISLGHVIAFLENYLREEWAVLRQVQVLEPGLAMLQTVMKARESEQ